MANVQDIINDEAISLTEDEVLEAVNEKLEGNDGKNIILAKITEILNGCEFPDKPTTEPATPDEPTTTEPFGVI